MGQPAACLDDDIITEFADGLLDDAGRRKVEEHIDTCADCRRLVSNLSLGQERARPVEAPTRVVTKSRSERDPVAVAGSVIDERYTLKFELGRGGMGSVWVAEDAKLRREVAVKLLIAKSSTDQAVSRFEREAMAIAGLRCINIVQVYDYGFCDGRPYIVMELLEGDDLATRLYERGTLPADDVATIVDGVAQALTVAHEAGIVHRDLKPGNVFLCDDQRGVSGGGLHIKVFDFGVAKMLRPHMRQSDSADTTSEGVVLGTPRYMSPEQVHGAKDIDQRADLWALGVIAYAALVGEPPFAGSGVGNIISQIMHRDAPAPSTRVDVPPSIDAFFRRALAKDIDDRFADAPTLARAFRESLRGDGDVSEAAPTTAGAKPAEPPGSRSTVWLWLLAAAAIVAAVVTMFQSSAIETASGDVAPSSPDAAAVNTTDTVATTSSPPEPTATPDSSGAASANPSSANVPGTPASRKSGSRKSASGKSSTATRRRPARPAVPKPPPAKETAPKTGAPKDKGRELFPGPF